MHEVLDILSNDHRHMERLLNCIDYQKDQLLDPACTNDVSIIMEILDYLTEYPGQCHHPAEECIYAVLLQKQAIAPELIWHIQIDHTELENLGKYVGKTLCGLVDGGDISKEYFVFVLEFYAQRQIDHMQREEQILFPAVRSNFSSKDWAKIGDELNEILAPVSGRDVHQEYEDFYERIMQAEKYQFTAPELLNYS